MQRIAMASLLALAAACSAGAQSQQEQSRASGAQGQRSFEVAGFDAVALGGPYDVVVAVGGAPSVRAEGDAETIARMEVRVEGGELRIEARRDGMFSRRDHGRATVHVTLPALRAATIGGSGDMRIDRVHGERFDASIAGSGDMEIAALQVPQTRFSVAGAGTIRAVGTTERANLSIAGAGDLSLAGLRAQNADVSVVGSGNVDLWVGRAVEGSVIGSGDVNISGPARCSVSRMGSGDIRCAG